MFLSGLSPEWYGGKAILASLGAQGYQHWNILVTRLEHLTYIFMSMSRLSPCSLAVTISKGFCLQQHWLGSHSVSCKLDVLKKNESTGNELNKFTIAAYISCRH